MQRIRMKGSIKDVYNFRLMLFRNYQPEKEKEISWSVRMEETPD